MSPLAQRCRTRASWAEIALWRIAVFQSSVSVGTVDLAEDEVDDAVADVLLVGHVVVERHRLDSEVIAEAAHRQRLEPTFVGQADRGAQDALPTQGKSGR